MSIKIGETFKTDIYGHNVDVRLLAVHDFGTIDVERISDGRCFRLSGLMFKPAPKRPAYLTAGGRVLLHIGNA